MFTAILILLAGAAAVLAASPSQAFRELSVLGGLICIAACFAAAGNPFNLRVALPFLGLGTACYALLLILIAGIAASFQQTAWLAVEELFVGFDNYRFYSHVQTVSLPLLALVAGAPNSRPSLRRFAFLGLSLSFALLWLSQGRATMLAVFVSTVAAVFLAGSDGWRFSKQMAAAAVLGAVMSLALTQAFISAVDPTALSSTTSFHRRLFLWGLAWDQIKSAPWLGIGPMHFAGHINIEAAHPHNIYLQIAAEWGLPMVLLMMAAAGGGLWRMGLRIRQCEDGEFRFLGIGLWAACLGIALDGLFSGNFVMPLSQCWIAAAIGFAVAWNQEAKHTILVKTAVRQATAAIGKSSFRWLGFFVAASQLWLIYEVQPEAANLRSHLEQVHRELASNERTNPRFWSHGWFRP